jgi:hypothetical protein
VLPQIPDDRAPRALAFSEAIGASA